MSNTATQLTQKQIQAALDKIQAQFDANIRVALVGKGGRSNASVLKS